MACRLGRFSRLRGIRTQDRSTAVTAPPSARVESAVGSNTLEVT